MKIKDILKKVTDGKELSDEEKEFLAEYDPEKDENRIPKSRLDQESAKARTEKERADGLQTQLDELQTRYEELENAGKTEAEKATAANAKALSALQKQVNELTKERDEAKASLAKSERTSAIGKIAGKHNFSDPDYLDYLANSKEIDLNDESAVAGFMKELGNSRPELFKSSAKSGGGTSGGGKADVTGHEARLKELLGKDELTTREANEVIELQGKIDSGKSAPNGENNGNATN